MAKSAEIASVSILLVGIAVLYLFGAYFYPKLTQVMEGLSDFQEIPSFDNQFCLQILRQSVFYFLMFVLPVMGAVFLAAFIANYVQVGFHPSSKAISPKLSKFNIISGAKRLVSLRSLVELSKSLIKLTIIGTVAYFAVRGEVDAILKLYNAEVTFIFLFILKGFFKIFIWVLIIMIVVAAIDYAYQKWQYEKDLKMTKQEVKEEAKNTEGDPHVKGRIRSIQMEMARKRMMAEVPEADVVITNPTRLAIAIKYDNTTMVAPQVVAKGAGAIAKRIKEIAAENDIPLMEDKPLAQALYKTVEIGEEIPANLFQAVAEILAHVYSIKNKAA